MKVFGRRVEKRERFIRRIMPARDQERRGQWLDIQLRRQSMHGSTVVLPYCPAFPHKEILASNYVNDTEQDQYSLHRLISGRPLLDHGIEQALPQKHE